MSLKWNSIGLLAKGERALLRWTPFVRNAGAGVQMESDTFPDMIFVSFNFSLAASSHTRGRLQFSNLG